MLQATDRLRVHLPECDNLDRPAKCNYKQHGLPSVEQHANSALLRLQLLPSGCVAECEVQLAESCRRQHYYARVHHRRLLVWVLRFEKLSERES